jgi:hypothetical protein
MFILFYINNVQVIFYKNNKVLANKIIAKINIAYAFYLIKKVKWFLNVCINCKATFIQVSKRAL